MILEVDVTDPDVDVEHRDQAPATLEQYGGRYLVRGREVTPHEGGWEPARLVVVDPLDRGGKRLTPQTPKTWCSSIGTGDSSCS